MTLVTLRVLLGHQWARHRFPLIPIMAAALAFEFLLSRIAPTPNEVSWMSSILAAAPPELLALAGNDVAMSTGGFLAIGYGHPFFLLLLSVWTVRTSSATLAGEIGLGTMDLVACRPVRRWTMVAAGTVTVGAGLAAIAMAAWFGTAIGLSLRPLGIQTRDFFPVAAGSWLLFFAWGTVGLLVSATRRHGGQAITWTTGLLAFSFVLDYLARLWEPIHRLRPLSLFRYYEPQLIFTSGLDAGKVAVLGIVAVLSLAAGIATFTWRDL